MHVALIKSRKEKQQKLSELEARARDVQLLKFGQIIDLEKLERLGINRNADELREKIQKEDQKRLHELEEWDVSKNLQSINFDLNFAHITCIVANQQNERELDRCYTEKYRFIGNIG
jgi:alpha-amylase/alpha-mannosidase (GH57 family)